MFEGVPIGVVWLVSVFVFSISIECGFLVAGLKVWHRDDDQKSQVGAASGAMLGLLAFILAITFGMAGERHSSRRQLVVTEVNAVEKAYLRSGFIQDEAMVQSIRTDLAEYVRIRLLTVELARDKKRDEAIDLLHQSEELILGVWNNSLPWVRDHSNEVLALYMDSLGQVMEINQRRIGVGLYSRIPPMIWITLYFVGIISMSVLGYRAGQAHRRSYVNVALALVFSSVIVLTVDLDSSRQTLFDVSQRSMISLSERLQADLNGK